MIKIDLFKKSYQNGVNEMIYNIANEFETPISTANKSTSKPLDKYWIALNKTEVVGSIGVLRIDNSVSILKNMFVKKEYRGKDYGIAQLLLNTIYDWCTTEDINYIYLGTMNQFKAAHKFYEKNGFEEINTKKLPSSFITNPIDDIYYKKVLPIN